MRRIFIFVIILCFISCANHTLKAPENAINSITARELHDHVEYLASDEMRGRSAPSPELKKCDEYIAEEFKSYGVKPAGDNNTYFQNFLLQRKTLDNSGEYNSFSVFEDNEEKKYKIKTDFAPLFETGDGEVKSNVVFAGYGITAPEYGYDDYKNLDVEGKIVLIMSHEPQYRDSTSIFNGDKLTPHSNIESKLENAKKHGAKGLLIFKSQRGRRPDVIWPSLLGMNPEKMRPVLYEDKNNNIPAVFIHAKIADEIFKKYNRSIKSIIAEIDKELVPESFELSDTEAFISAKLSRTNLPTRNVVGLIEGRDKTLRNEVVIIGAHYDHVGVVNDSVYNGADDNASGTSGVIELAEAFSIIGKLPKRSILFIAFSAEEIGLIGSTYYTQSPIYPLKNTAAVLNMDMISRNDENDLGIVGHSCSPDLKKIVTEENEKVGFDLDFNIDNAINMISSDHYPFLNRQIPALSFHSKEHPDLHQPGDDIEKINPVKMEKAVKLVFLTAWKIANIKDRPGAYPFVNKMRSR